MHVKDTEPRQGMPSPTLDETTFRERFLSTFRDPAFDALRAQLEAVAGAAWDGYRHSRKSPATRKAGPGFADPDYDLAVDWIEARDAIHAAQARHDDAGAAPRILIVVASPRSEHTCPGEMSKTWRLAAIARELCIADGLSAEMLDLSRLASEYGRHIHPCKACFSTSPAQCHWPCSCYPNYALGQTQDWMNEIYPKWVEAQGVMLVTPVHWYQATSPLKLMMDRLVCADGGNPDPSRTHGKDAAKAKEIELEGWDYPRHLAGRIYSVVVHGDAEGAENVRRALSDWLSSMGLLDAGHAAQIDRYVGYYEPYATSHAALDKDDAIRCEVGNAARTLIEAVRAARDGGLIAAGRDLKEPRPK
jgi:multimeric flavodoxin WrbA